MTDQQGKRPCRLFIFDLDGTLIDSREDIVCSLNLALSRMNLSTLCEERIADFVGDGVHKLVERALCEARGKAPDVSLIRQGVDLFKKEYECHLVDRTTLCHQAEEALDMLAWARFAVATNKLENFSIRILDALGIGDRFSIVIGGDSVKNRKPDPESLLKAMAFCGVLPAETVMVGDSLVDIEAGKAAGTITCGITGRFRPKNELERAGCDLIITRLPQLADYFRPPE
ncbi:MAG TPA: HAD-IA family hydrolase [Acidobacteriota bacterium]|nr:HAD-IA family hydrolase [Acidobacteriota bacterium]